MATVYSATVTLHCKCENCGNVDYYVRDDIQSRHEMKKIDEDQMTRLKRAHELASEAYNLVAGRIPASIDSMQIVNGLSVAKLGLETLIRAFKPSR